MKEKLLCPKCKGEWAIQKNLAAYEGEIVLVCLGCGDRYFNAQKHFYGEAFIGLKEVNVKD